MSAVVQIGSMILRSECSATFSVDSAKALGIGNKLAASTTNRRALRRPRRSAIVRIVHLRFDTRRLEGSGRGRIEPHAPTLVKHGTTIAAEQRWLVEAPPAYPNRAPKASFAEPGVLGKPATLLASQQRLQ